MARSVSLPSGTVGRVYYDVSFMGDDGFNWQNFKDDLSESLRSDFPSLYECSEWLGREDLAFLKNKFAYFGLSEYCGIAALWIAERETDLPQGLKNKFLDRACDVLAARYGDLIKVATFSNGESVFRRKAA